VSHRAKKKPDPPAPTTEPTVEDYLEAVEAHKRFEAARERLAESKPLTMQEALNMLAGLRHLARLANGER
jgi:hypothetical protein